MFESLVGRSTPVTRQVAGMFANCSPEGSAKFPAGIDAALVMVVSGSCSDVSDAQSGVRAEAPKLNAASAAAARWIASRIGRLRVIMFSIDGPLCAKWWSNRFAASERVFARHAGHD